MVQADSGRLLEYIRRILPLFLEQDVVAVTTLKSEEYTDMYERTPNPVENLNYDLRELEARHILVMKDGVTRLGTLGEVYRDILENRKLE